LGGAFIGHRICDTVVALVLGLADAFAVVIKGIGNAAVVDTILIPILGIADTLAILNYIGFLLGGCGQRWLSSCTPTVDADSQFSHILYKN